MLKKVRNVIISSIVSFALLTVFCFFYYNNPVHYDSKDGATDYVWESNKFHSQWTEGFSYGRTNNEGYANTYDYIEGMNIDVLIMGSSQMEAFNVKDSESTAYLLGKELGKTVYNIGVSDHFFLTCVDNISAAVNKYNPEIVVIETHTLSFDDDDIQAVLDRNYPQKESHGQGVLELLQKNQFLRCVYTKLKLAKSYKTQHDEEHLDSSYSENLSALFGKIINDVGNSKCIILYKPNTSDEDSLVFEQLCLENNIVFLDMRPRFKEEYIKNNIYPYGFSNTSVNKGHLNKYGHIMIADELARVIGGML